MFNTTKEKVDFAYFAAQAYLNNETRDRMIGVMLEKYPDIGVDILECAWRCIDAHSDLTA